MGKSTAYGCARSDEGRRESYPTGAPLKSARIPSAHTLNLKLATTDRSLRATWSRERTARLAPGQELRAIADKPPAAMQLPQGPPFSWDRACRHIICEAILYYPRARRSSGSPRKRGLLIAEPSSVVEPRPRQSRALEQRAAFRV